MIIIVALLVLALDQISKYWIVNHHLIGQLGYSGSLFDLDALRAFLTRRSGASATERNGPSVCCSR